MISDQAGRILAGICAAGVVALCVLAICSCAGGMSETKNPSTTDSLTTISHQMPPPAATIPPNIARMRGTIIRIDSAFHTQAAMDPCSKYPCTATVRVDSIFGYGMAFPSPLWVGEEIQIRFIFSLAPTAIALPRIQPACPGLSVGSMFVADVDAHEGPGTAPSIDYTVFGYEVRH